MMIYLVVMGDDSVWWYTSQMRYFVSEDQARKYAQKLNDQIIAAADGTPEDLDECYQVWEIEAGGSYDIR